MKKVPIVTLAHCIWASLAVLPVTQPHLARSFINASITLRARDDLESRGCDFRIALHFVHPCMKRHSWLQGH